MRSMQFLQNEQAYFAMSLLAMLESKLHKLLLKKMNKKIFIK
jgi:hypothetical protein